jgi:hypothetical protein
LRYSNRLSWLTLGVSLCLAHCATAEQDDAEPAPAPIAGTGGTTGGAKSSGGASPNGGTGGTRAYGGAAPTGGARATGGASSNTGKGGRAATNGGQSSGTGGKSGQGGSSVFGGGTQLGGETGYAGEPSLPSTGGVMTGTGGATPADPCSDGERNGTETDVDCGGACAPCEGGKACKVGGDCRGAVCRNLACIPDHCGDGAPSGNETDEDCGGSCSQCALGMGCETSADCEAGNCDGGTCAVPGNCVYGWRDDPCGQTCLARTQSDQRACEQVLDCFIEHDCGPATCTDNTQVCGNNALQNGSAPYPYAAAVYDCMCN